MRSVWRHDVNSDDWSLTDRSNAAALIDTTSAWIARRGAHRALLGATENAGHGKCGTKNAAVENAGKSLYGKP